MSKWMKEPLCLPEETEQAFEKREMPILEDAYGCIMQAVGTVTNGALERELGKRSGKSSATHWIAFLKPNDKGKRRGFSRPLDPLVMRFLEVTP